MFGTVITSAGTIILSGRAAQFCEEIATMQKQIDAVRIGSVEFHFVGPKVSVKVVESRLLRRDD